jgi:hypothetical protein
VLLPAAAHSLSDHHRCLCTPVLQLLQLLSFPMQHTSATPCFWYSVTTPNPQNT